MYLTISADCNRRFDRSGPAVLVMAGPSGGGGSLESGGQLRSSFRRLVKLSGDPDQPIKQHRGEPAAGWVPPVGLEPTLGGFSVRCLCQLGYGGARPAPEHRTVRPVGRFRLTYPGAAHYRGKCGPRDVGLKEMTQICVLPRSSEPVVAPAVAVPAGARLTARTSAAAAKSSSKACRTTLFECLAPPFSGVVGSGRWCGVNVGSRVVQAGFTDT